MQQLDDLKEKLIEQAKNLWSRLQEQPLYLDLKERFEALPSKTQKLVLGGVVGGIFFILVLFPISFLWTSWSQMSLFEEARDVTEELLIVEREAQSVASLPRPDPIPVLKSRVQNLLANANLTSDQILPMEDLGPVQPRGVLPPQIQPEGLKVKLAKLNLRQITDIGSQLESQFREGVNIWSFSMKQNSELPEYFDVEYHLVAFYSAGTEGE
jgi:hypothetical protein